MGRGFSGGGGHAPLPLSLRSNIDTVNVVTGRHKGQAFQQRRQPSLRPPAFAQKPNFTLMPSSRLARPSPPYFLRASDAWEWDCQLKLYRRWWMVSGRHEAVCTSWRRRSSVRRKQMATTRIPPKSKVMSPMLNSPSHA